MEHSGFLRRGAWLGALLLVSCAVLGADDNDKDGNSGDEDDRVAEPLPPYLGDRGTGVPTSLATTYVREGELLTALEFRYRRDHNYEYDPNELGFSSTGEFKGKYWDESANVLVAYGLDDNLVLELGAAAARAALQKADEDLSGMPEELKESGLGNLGARLDWRIRDETADHAELFTYLGVLVPHDESHVLIGTPAWLGSAGAGIVRGFDWGTMTFRMGIEYDFGSASELDWGEVAVEYLKRISPALTAYGALQVLEGDEYSVVGELQWQLSPTIVLKLNSGAGLTSHGMDWAPRVGLLMSFPD